MKQSIKIIGILLTISFFVYFVYDFLSGIGYDKQHWIYRKASHSIAESLQRKVFVKKLRYEINSYSGPQFYFEAFIEKAFTHGRKSVDETVLMRNTSFPYRLSFNSRPIQQVSIFIKRDQLQKFDSVDAVWGYLKHPYLSDTILLEIRGEGIKSGIIRVW